MNVFIVSAARTPIGNFNGALGNLPAHELGSIVIKEVLLRAHINGADVNEIILGQSLTAGQGQNTARQAAWKAGIPKHVPAFVLNMLCGSGLKSIMLGYQAIKCGDADIMICGGQESMSQAPHAVHLRGGIKMGSGTLVDTMLHDGLTDAFCNIHMGETAENLAKKYNISREEQDQSAVQSQKLAAKAQKNGYFEEEIIAVPITDRNGTIIFSEDEYLKHDTTLESLKKLRPCFVKNGTVTAGNASGINDSAAAVLLMSENELKKRGIIPLAKIIAFAQSGCDPDIMGIGPVEAVENVLKKAGWTKHDVDLYELNEAFAAQALSVNKALGLNAEKVNINGGAIALGHPIAASGTRVLVTLIHALKRTGGKKGIASLCIGGGMGIAMAIEMV